MFQPHIRRRLIFAASLQLMNSACVQSSFQYTAKEPVRFEPADRAKESPVFYGEAQGFLWSGCNGINAEAVDQLLKHAQADGYDAVADLKWYDFDSGKWIKKPNCRSEYGWFSGSLLTLWWPKATKVKVQARGVKNIPETEKADFFQAKTIGKTNLFSYLFLFGPVISQLDIRPTKADDAFVSFGFSPAVLVGLGNGSLRAGKYYDSDTRWAVNTEALGRPSYSSLYATSEASQFCAPNSRRISSSGLDGNGLLGVGTVSLRREKFIGKNFYYGIGPAIQNHRYYLECETSVSIRTQDGLFSRTERTTSEYTWEHALVGIDVGIGYESPGPSGVFTNCELGGVFGSAKVWERGKEPEYGPRIPNFATPRLLMCSLGLLF